MEKITAETPCQVLLEKPTPFTPIWDTAACYCLWNGQALFLKRAPHKLAPLTWGVPAGKTEADETIDVAARRELEEETGIKRSSDEISYFRSVFVQYPNFDFNYHIFFTVLDEKPEVTISASEHIEYQWATYEDALSLPFVPGGKECLQLVQSHIPDLLK